ncbi:hypothetical protein SISNIDRAFT_483050 [Sistotremastrum niveocremeum HHB9708]|uniref:Transmembrane protein n=1 Tax=Sistotremastrum niveocremeum HHB9708 TaxID=1314777 RepID=A0A164Y1K9_9AGAM|nr:hypothetical protein SISNIDRAFT_483050 [Sistotremastrum niveocremeum HHB9708]
MFRLSYFIGILSVLAVATFAVASAIPAAELEKRAAQHICQAVGVPDVDTAIAGISTTAPTVAQFTALTTALSTCATAITAAKVDASVVVDLSVNLFILIHDLLVKLDIAVIIDIVAQVDLDIHLKAILDVIAVIKVNADVAVGAAGSYNDDLSLSVPILQVFANIKVFLFIKALGLSTVVLSLLGILNIIIVL